MTVYIAPSIKKILNTLEAKLVKLTEDELAMDSLTIELSNLAQKGKFEQPKALLSRKICISISGLEQILVQIRDIEERANRLMGGGGQPGSKGNNLISAIFVLVWVFIFVGLGGGLILRAFE